MCPANQPLQRKDLPAHLVLACVRRRRHLRQSAAVDFETVNHVRPGKSHVSAIGKFTRSLSFAPVPPAVASVMFDSKTTLCRRSKTLSRIFRPLLDNDNA